MREQRVLLHLDERTRRAIDPGDVYFLEADGSDTLLRLRASRRFEPYRGRVYHPCCGSGGMFVQSLDAAIAANLEELGYGG